VLKGSFPLPVADVETVLATLGVSGAESTRDSYTLEQLLDEVVGPNESLTAVSVHKRRTHYEFAGCMTELSEISVDGRSTRTIAVETTDPALVSAAVRELGLHDRPNVCLARGLKTMLGL
jgi:exopolyphosphatase / guanosine-5'-triphosphate,3'-diphosphate pyrophosphatase